MFFQIISLILQPQQKQEACQKLPHNNNNIHNADNL